MYAKKATAEGNDREHDNYTYARTALFLDLTTHNHCVLVMSIVSLSQSFLFVSIMSKRQYGTNINVRMYIVMYRKMLQYKQNDKKRL